MSQAESLFTILTLAGAGIAVNWLAYIQHFFHIIDRKKKSIPFDPTVIGICFIIFFVTTYALVPFIFSFATKASFSVRLHETIPREVLINSAHAAAMFLTLIILLVYLRSNSKRAFDPLLSSDHSIGEDIGVGALGWIISFPVVLLVGHIVGIISYALFQDVGEVQNAIKHIQTMRSFPIALIFTIFSVSLLAPITEELLFRGVLQTWFTSRLGRTKSIILTSIIFAAVHFSTSHGVGNISLIFSLFTLSIYLGFVYERQRNIIAPFIFHAIFNSISVARIIME